MNIGLICSKYNEDSNSILNTLKSTLEATDAIIDYSYFETNIESDRQNIENIYIRNQKILNSNNAFVFDTTYYSSGIGFLISEALNLKKPALVLFNRQIGKQTSGIIVSSATNSKLLKFREYTTQSIEKEISEFLDFAQQNQNTKFILSVPSTINHYLEWACFERHTTKADVVRDAIRHRMKSG